MEPVAAGAGAFADEQHDAVGVAEAERATEINIAAFADAGKIDTGANEMTAIGGDAALDEEAMLAGARA